MEYTQFLKPISCQELRGYHYFAFSKEKIQPIVEFINELYNKFETIESEDELTKKALAFYNENNKPKLQEIIYTLNHQDAINCEFFSIFKDEEFTYISFKESLSENNDHIMIFFNKDVAYQLVGNQLCSTNSVFDVEVKHYDDITYKFKDDFFEVNLTNKARYGEEPNTKITLSNKFEKYAYDFDITIDNHTLQFDNEKNKYRNKNNYEYFYPICLVDKIEMQNNEIEYVYLYKKALDELTLSQKIHNVSFENYKEDSTLKMTKNQYVNFLDDMQNQIELNTLISDKKVDMHFMSISDLEHIVKKINIYEQNKSMLFDLKENVSINQYTFSEYVKFGSFFVGEYQATQEIKEVKDDYFFYCKTLMSFVSEIKCNEIHQKVKNVENEVNYFEPEKNTFKRKP